LPFQLGLASLIAPALLVPGGSLDVSVGNHYLLAGCVTAATAYKTRSVLVTVVLGLAVMFALRWFGA
jgi:branched-subunit amino acid transport protein